eukprot:7157513-Lingulodinium_polyedra.AAC.1
MESPPGGRGFWSSPFAGLPAVAPRSFGRRSAMDLTRARARARAWRRRLAVSKQLPGTFRPF